MVIAELLTYSLLKWLHSCWLAKHWTYGLVNVAFKDFNTTQSGKQVVIPGENDADKQTVKLAYFWKCKTDIQKSQKYIYFTSYSKSETRFPPTEQFNLRNSKFSSLLWLLRRSNREATLARQFIAILPFYIWI